jgi:hypothetical protein
MTKLKASFSSQRSHRGRATTSRPRSHRSRRKRSRRVQQKLRGGAAVASGESGCLFKPALRCVSSSSEYDGVSKLMKRENARQEAAITEVVQRAFGDADEYDELNKYFILPRLCLDVAPLRRKDLVGFDTFCSRCLNTSAADINRHLNNVSALQQADGGQSISNHYKADDNGKAMWDFPVFYASFLDLLLSGIARLNAAGVFHNDVKEDNLVFDGTRVRLIDWDRAGISVVVPKQVMIASGVNRPPAYMLNSDLFQKFILKRENINKTNEEVTAYLMEVLASTSRPHAETEESVAAFFGVGNLLDLYSAQILDVLATFRKENDTGVFTFDITGYTAVLRKNMDVYGWLFVNAFCLLPDNATSIFKLSSLQSMKENYPRIVELVQAHFYTSKLSTAYDVPAIVEEFYDAAALNRRASSSSRRPSKRRKIEGIK